MGDDRDDLTSGDYRRALEALRDRLAREIRSPLTPPTAVASLARQLADVLKTLHTMPADKGASAVDDLAKRRAARRSGAKAPEDPPEADKRGAGGDGTSG